MISPHIVNMRMKRIQMLLSVASDEREYFVIAHELEDIETHGLDTDIFTPAYAEAVHEHLENAIAYAFLCLPTHVLQCIEKIRECLQPIFVQNLLLVNRFFKQDSDVGTLASLPDGILFEIQKEIYKYI